MLRLLELGSATKRIQLWPVELSFGAPLECLNDRCWPISAPPVRARDVCSQGTAGRVAFAGRKAAFEPKSWSQAASAESRPFLESSLERQGTSLCHVRAGAPCCRRRVPLPCQHGGRS